MLSAVGSRSVCLHSIAASMLVARPDKHSASRFCVRARSGDAVTGHLAVQSMRKSATRSGNRRERKTTGPLIPRRSGGRATPRPTGRGRGGAVGTDRPANSLHTCASRRPVAESCRWRSWRAHRRRRRPSTGARHRRRSPPPDGASRRRTGHPQTVLLRTSLRGLWPRRRAGRRRRDGPLACHACTRQETAASGRPRICAVRPAQGTDTIWRTADREARSETLTHTSDCGHSPAQHRPLRREGA